MNQTKNRNRASGDVFVHPDDVAQVKSSHPVLTLVMEHGVTPANDAERWEISCDSPVEI